MERWRGRVDAAEDSTFEKGDKIISYRKVTLTQEGYKLSEHTPVELLLMDRTRDQKPVKAKRRSSAGSKQPEPVISAEEAALEEKLRAWRLAEAGSSKSGLLRLQ